MTDREIRMMLASRPIPPPSGEDYRASGTRCVRSADTQFDCIRWTRMNSVTTSSYSCMCFAMAIG